jgi:transposase
MNVVERSFAWATRFRRLAKDYERSPAKVAVLHIVAFASLFLPRAIAALVVGP